MKRFAVLLAVVCLVVAGFGVFAGTGKLSPVNTEHKPYVSYPSFPELKNYRFMLSSYQNRVAQGDNPVPVFGSSELNPRRANSKFHMVTLFRQNNYGMDVMAMGRGSIVNLWDAIEIGALSGQLQDKRVVIMPSMQWFMCYRNPQASFPATFSVGAWRALMENSAVSDSTKDEIRQTMASEYGVNRTDAGLGLSGLVDGIDDTVGQTVSDIQLKHLLRHPKEGGADFVSGMPHALTETQRSHASGQEQIPDWKNIFAQADAAARKKSGQNPYGFYHKWYGKGKPFKTWVKGARASWGFKEGKPYSDSEYRAFELVLKSAGKPGWNRWSYCSLQRALPMTRPSMARMSGRSTTTGCGGSARNTGCNAPTSRIMNTTRTSFTITRIHPPWATRTIRRQSTSSCTTSPCGKVPADRCRPRAPSRKGGVGGVGRAKRARLRSRAGMRVSGCAVKIIVA